MFTGKKGIIFITRRILLLAGYLFLFSLQFNSRYFAIANNFVYGQLDGQPAGVDSQLNRLCNISSTGIHQDIGNPKRPGHGVLVHFKSRNPSHLGVDKRFHFKQAILVPGIRGPDRTFFAPITTFISNYFPYHSSSELPVNAFRGPPGVHDMLRCC
ncbi:MAG TPA: hypothetical protein VHE34_00490 [Puia sp.]|uniref:hypothetical protein n=1 Tax=Puia sp. TaxID=2045100 RepID=UPI002D00A49B|nr:hypothetical protein [Puia sp.]HVU93662.1 hypothetical protein [Puia sp.]